MASQRVERDVSAALSYHEATKHSEARLRRDRHWLDWANRPISFKIYRGLTRVELIADADVLLAGDEPLLAGPRREPDDTAPERIPDLASLSRLLYLSAGIIKRRSYPGGELYFRAYPNTGALYHIDLYVISAALADLAAGVYHFGVNDFTLHRLREGDYRAELAAASGGHPRVEEAPVVLVSVSTYWRNAWKYRARTYRHCFWDGGTMHANLLEAARRESLAPCVVAGFVDARIEALLGLDASREGTLSMVPLGRTRAAVPPIPPVPPLDVQIEPVSPREVDYPEIRAVHAASSLADGEEARAWRGGTPEVVAPPSTKPTVALRTSLEPATDTLATVIRRRGSTRAFDRRRSITFEALSTALRYATRPIPADFLDPPDRTLIELYLIVHAVEELAPGAYYFHREDQSLELLRGGTFRREAGRLGLSQALPADAAVNVYALCDLVPALARFGNRGYRAAQLEGGILGGRLYHAAYAQRLGATGLTFYDDEVTEFFSPHAGGKGVMFLTALGYADKKALRGQ